MKIVNQHNFDYISEKDFDLFIVASGFEQRAIFQSQRYKGKAKRKLAFAFNNEVDNPNRIINDFFLKNEGFDLITIDGDTSELFYMEDLLNEIINENEKKEQIDIYIDYSSMTRNWYAHLLVIFKKFSSCKNIKVYFGYSYAKYSPKPQEDILNRIVEPLLGYCNLSVPFKPTALVICLGNERNRAYGLQEYFDATTYLFYSDNSFNIEFSNEVEEVNKDILTTTKIENIFKFPVYDMMLTNYLLSDVCSALSKDFRVVLAPCGPKPFTLLSLINALIQGSDIEVWRISPGKHLPITEREANGDISILELFFQRKSD